jgi:hypothetical protein
MLSRTLVIINLITLILFWGCSEPRRDRKNCVSYSYDEDNPYQKTRRNGRIKKIVETRYDIDYKFDEFFETKRDSSKYFYNESGKLVESHFLGITPFWVEATDGMNKIKFRYDENQRLKSKIEFLRNGEMYRYTKYTHDSSGLLLVIESYTDSLKWDIESRETRTYDSSKRVVRLSWWVKESDIDSTITKYQYDNTGRLSKSIKYDKTGKRIAEQNIIYQEEQSQIIVNYQTYPSYGMPTMSKSKTVMYFNDSCNLSVRTSVTRDYDRTICRKTTFNAIGDVVETIEFVPKENVLEFPKEVDLSKVKVLNSAKYTYTTDKQGNWIERHDKTSVVKRMITYY